MNAMKTLMKTLSMLLLGAAALLLLAVPALAQETGSITLPSVSLQVREIISPLGSAYTQLPGSRFEFVLEGQDGAPMPVDSTGNTRVLTLTAAQDASGSVVLSGSLGTLQDVSAGLYTYTVRQRLPATDTEGKKYAYDATQYEMQILLEWKDGIAGGEMLSTVTISKNGVKQGDGALSFVNQAVLADPPIEKRVQGNPPTDDLFTFEMEAGSPQFPMPYGSSEGIKRMTTGAGGSEFGMMTFVRPGTYTYTLREVDEGTGQYEYDTNEYLLKIIVTSNGGVFSTTHSFTKIGGTGALQNQVVFTNLYTGGDEDPVLIPVEVAFPGGGITKALTGSTPSSHMQFVFDIIGRNVSQPARTCPMPGNAAGGEASVAITGAGTVNPGKITFSDVGDYEYTITERAGNASGYTYSQQTYKVYISIRDSGDGTLHMTQCDIYADGSQASSIVFTNAYSASTTPTPTPKPGGGGGNGGGGGKGQWYSTPKTGDDTNVALMWILSGASGAGMALCVAWPRRKRHEGL